MSTAAAASGRRKCRDADPAGRREGYLRPCSAPTSALSPCLPREAFRLSYPAKNRMTRRHVLRDPRCTCSDRPLLIPEKSDVTPSPVHTRFSRSHTDNNNVAFFRNDYLQMVGISSSRFSLFREPVAGSIVVFRCGAHLFCLAAAREKGYAAAAVSGADADPILSVD